MAILNEIKRVTKKQLSNLIREYGHEYLLDTEYYLDNPGDAYYDMSSIDELYPEYKNNLSKPFDLSAPYFRVDGYGKVVSMTQDDVDSWEYDSMQDVLRYEYEDFIEWCENKGLLENIKTYRGIKITESQKKSKLTVEELWNKLEDEYGEDFGNFHYFSKDGVDLGTESDLEEVYGIRDWYDLKVLDYRPGYYEYIITLDLDSKSLPKV